MNIMKKAIRGTVTVMFCALAPISVMAGPYEDGLAADSARNYAVSFPAFQKAANQGHAKAHLKLANHYLYGKGIQKSGSKAINSFMTAGSLGEISGYSKIAYMYEEGLGIAKSPTKSAEWSKKAAELGHYMGQYKYARALMRGNGVTKDEPKALYWYKLAAAQGHMMSRGHVNVLAKQGIIAWQSPDAPKSAPVQVATTATKTVAKKLTSLGGVVSPDRLTQVRDIMDSAEVSFKGNRLVGADHLYPKPVNASQSDTFWLPKYFTLRPSYRNSAENVIERTFIPNDKYVTQANSKKKYWADKKRPKNGTGYGTYKQGNFTYVGNWLAYKIDGKFKKYFKNALIFDGVAKNGVIKRGIKYKLDPYMPLYSSRYTDEEYTALAWAEKGTYSIPIYDGKWVVTQQDGDTTSYAFAEGTEYYSPRYYSRSPHYSHIRWVPRKRVNNEIVLHGRAIQIELMGKKGAYFPELQSISNYKDGKLHGPFIDYKGHWDIVSTDFKNGEYAKTNLFVINKDDASLQTLPFRNLKPDIDVGINNIMLQFKSAREQAGIDLKRKQIKERREAKRAAEEYAILHASKQTGFDYYAKGNFRKSHRILYRFAEQGHADAQNLIGLMHQNGYGQTTNIRVAKRYFLKAADQNFAAAQHNLGWIYYYIDNYESDRDKDKARAWFAKAANQGFEPSIEMLKVMNEIKIQSIADMQKQYYKKNKWSFGAVMIAAGQQNSRSYSQNSNGNSSSQSYNNSSSARTYSDPFGGLNPYDSEYQTVREIECRACTYQNKYD